MSSRQPIHALVAGVVAAAIIALGLGAASGARAASLAACPKLKLAFQYTKVPLSAQATSCTQARKLAVAWGRRLIGHPHSPCMWRDGTTRPGSCIVLGWRCLAYHTANGGTYPVSCTPRTHPGNRRVRFILAV